MSFYLRAISVVRLRRQLTSWLSLRQRLWRRRQQQPATVLCSYGTCGLSSNTMARITSNYGEMQAAAAAATHQPVPLGLPRLAFVRRPLRRPLQLRVEVLRPGVLHRGQPEVVRATALGASPYLSHGPCCSGQPNGRSAHWPPPRRMRRSTREECAALPFFALPRPLCQRLMPLLAVLQRRSDQKTERQLSGDGFGAAGDEQARSPPRSNSAVPPPAPASRPQAAHSNPGGVSALRGRTRTTRAAFSDKRAMRIRRQSYQVAV